MTNQYLRISTTLLVLWSVGLLMVGCPSEPQQNISQQPTEKLNADLSEADKGGSPPSDPCTATDPIKALQAEADQITNDTDLDYLRNDGKWLIKIEPDAEFGIVMRVRGRIWNRSGSGPNLKKLLKFIDDRTKNLKKGCVGRVRFETLNASATDRGFEWSACESGYEPCQGGFCRPIGQCVAPTPKP